MTEINPENVQDGLDNYPVAFLQHLIDNGEGWKVQSDLARAIMKALEDGTCVLGPVAHRDYNNRVVPARSEVEPGAVPGFPDEIVCPRCGASAEFDDLPNSYMAFARR